MDSVYGGSDFEPVFNVRSVRPSYYQVIGERCSGTNYLSALVRLNTNLLLTDVGGWKHSFPSFVAIPDSVVLLIVARNAVSWSLSLHKSPWHAVPGVRGMVYSEFIRHRWDSVVDHEYNFSLPPGDSRRGLPLQYDRHPLTGKRFDNIFGLRTAKLLSHKSILCRDVNAALITHESLLENPERFLDAFTSSFQIDRKKLFVNPSAKFGGRTGSSPFESSQNLGNHISFRDLKYLNSEIDDDLESFFGYRYHSSGG